MTTCSMEAGERYVWVDVSPEKGRNEDAAFVFWGYLLFWEKLLYFL